MTPEQFAYWLQGYVELTRGSTPDDAQWKSICEHLSTLFEKVTPQVGPGPSVFPTKPETPIDVNELVRQWNERNTVYPGLSTQVTC